MSSQFLPMYYEGDIEDWLKTRFPTIEPSNVIEVGKHTYHILLSNSDANIIKDHLTKGLEPPFKRRTPGHLGTRHPSYEPGLCFEYYNDQCSIAEMTCFAAAYRRSLPRVSSSGDRDYISTKIADLDTQISKSNDRL